MCSVTDDEEGLEYFSCAGFAFALDPADLTLVPVSSCLSLNSTFSLPSNPTVTPSHSPSASTRIDKAVLAANVREIFPLSFGGAWPTREAW